MLKFSFDLSADSFFSGFLCVALLHCSFPSHSSSLPSFLPSSSSFLEPISLAAAVACSFVDVRLVRQTDRTGACVFYRF